MEGVEIPYVSSNNRQMVDVVFIISITVFIENIVKFTLSFSTIFYVLLPALFECSL